MDFYVGVALKKVDDKYTDICVFPSTSRDMDDVIKTFNRLKRFNKKTNKLFKKFVSKHYSSIFVTILKDSFTQEEQSKAIRQICEYSDEELTYFFLEHKVLPPVRLNDETNENYLSIFIEFCFFFLLLVWLTDVVFKNSD